MQINWKAVWDWTKRAIGFIAIAAPVAKKALDTGDFSLLIPVIGGVMVHQARRFGDGKKLNKKLEPAKQGETP